MNVNDNKLSAEICIKTTNLNKEIDFFENKLDFRLVEIYPADSPLYAILTGQGICVRLIQTENLINSPNFENNISINIKKTKKDQLINEISSPSGIKINFKKEYKSYKINKKNNQLYEICYFKENQWKVGRAEMFYRDLIVSRFMSTIIASHIKIPKGGNINDRVHYHDIDFQIIFCINGWVKVIYEDQGNSLILNPGDCVLQAPQIRHRVVESSNNLEVVEVSLPSDHITKFDYNTKLPTGLINKNKLFNGMKFCHFDIKKSIKKKFEGERNFFYETGIYEASNKKGSVRFLELETEFKQKNYQNDFIQFYYIYEGKISLKINSDKTKILSKNDSFSFFSMHNFIINPLTTGTKVIEVIARK